MRVLVVGAGVVGLSCAVELAGRGHDVHVLARDLPAETTSSIAAALWYPYRALPRDRVTAWSSQTYGALERIAAEAPDSGVRMLAGSELHRRPEPDPWWASALPGLRRVQEPPAGYADGWTFVAPVVDMAAYLPWLVERLLAAGGTLTRLALPTLPTGADVVVNAAGLGARALVDDEAMSPVRGQVVLLEQVGLDRWWLDGAGLTYVVPRLERVVVGGSDEEGSWDRHPDPELAAAMLARATALVPELEGARVVGHRVGLRPARPAVRLQRQARPGASPVVHCYGHGGAGLTLSWGCAREVADLVEAG